MNKKIIKGIEVRTQIEAAVKKVTGPVIETIGPRGKNVFYETDKGAFELTRDGFTVARNINLEDSIENAVAEIIKAGALSTNKLGGDGTSTTELYSFENIGVAYELEDQGVAHRDITRVLDTVAEKYIKRLSEMKREVNSDKTLKEIATISANGDTEMAEQVVETINTADLDGMVYIEISGNDKTILEKQQGFRVAPGMIYERLYTNAAQPMMAYPDLPILILDKKLYYAEETEHIIRTAMQAGHKAIGIIAKDFLGDSLNTLITNHSRGALSIVLAKIDSDTTLADLALYLGGHVVSESDGRRTDSVTADDFVFASRVAADPDKVLFTHTKSNPELEERVKWLKSELEKDKENKQVKQRLASLTTGIVTIKVGGRTLQEARERVYRFEDAINATRAAKKSGYLVGGGLSMYVAFLTTTWLPNELKVAERIGRASIIRIAKNAQLTPDWSKITHDTGLNANTGEYENLLESGVVEPFQVTELALRNAASVASTITSIGTFILNDYESTKESDK